MGKKINPLERKYFEKVSLITYKKQQSNPNLNTLTCQPSSLNLVPKARLE